MTWDRAEGGCGFRCLPWPSGCGQQWARYAHLAKASGLQTQWLLASLLQSLQVPLSSVPGSHLAKDEVDGLK